jgi:hypothetical protein
MLKLLAVTGCLALLVTVGYVVRSDQVHDTEGKGYDIKCKQPSDPSAAVGTIVCTAEHSQKAQSGEYQPVWWHVFFTWPEGITALLLLLTLAAITWQSMETSKAADAALTQIKMTKNRERPRLMVVLGDVDLRVEEAGVPIVIECKIINRGESVAFPVVGRFNCWIGSSEGPEEPMEDREMSLPSALDPRVPYDPVLIVWDVNEDNSVSTWDKDDPRLKGIKSGEYCIYLTGSVLYRNRDEELWIMKFRRRYTSFQYGHGFAEGVWSKYGVPKDAEEYEIHPEKTKWWKFCQP